MELALITRQTQARSELLGASRRLLLLLAVAYAVAYIVPACISHASRQVDEETGSSTFIHGPTSNLHAELVCGTASPGLWERSECNMPK